jgi:hypothetical protein
VAAYSWTAPDLQLRGPVVNAIAAVSTPLERMLRAAGLHVPPPVPVTALVDTGAFNSAIDRNIVLRLGLRPVGAALISSPGPVARPVRVLQYAVQIVLPTLDAVDITVIEAQVDETIQAVLGRDILAHAIFIYNGFSGECTISF